VEKRSVAKHQGKKPNIDDLIPIDGEPAEEPTEPLTGSTSSVISSSGTPVSTDALASLTDVLISGAAEETEAAAPSSDVFAPPADWGEVAPPSDISAPPEEWGEVALVEGPGKESAEEEKKAEGPAEKKGFAGRLAAHPSLLASAEWVALGCLALALLAVGYFGVIFFSTAIYAIALVSIGYSIWLGRKTNTVYTVFLGCALAAVVTIAYFLWLEIGRYQFDVRARGATSRVSVLFPAQLGPTSTTAAAWPHDV
jgi:hypothetical protein